MVKNNGGNKAKKIARKTINIPDRSTRLASVDGEIYAVVIKLMGNNICNVFCIDGEERMCVIRKKFSGKGKRDNFLSRGKWVLVGLRSWEVTSKDKEKCDLLEVYSDHNKEILIKNSKEDFRPFLSIIQDDCDVNQDYIEFINSKEEEVDLLCKDNVDGVDNVDNVDNVDGVSSSDDGVSSGDDEVPWYSETENVVVTNIIDDISFIDINDI